MITFKFHIYNLFQFIHIGISVDWSLLSDLAHIEVYRFQLSDPLDFCILYELFIHVKIYYMTCSVYWLAVLINIPVLVLVNHQKCPGMYSFG